MDKRILAMILAITMTVSMVPGQAFAAAATEPTVAEITAAA